MFVADLEPSPALVKIMDVFNSFEICKSQRGLKKKKQEQELREITAWGNLMFYCFLKLAFLFMVVIIILTAQFWFV